MPETGPDTGIYGGTFNPIHRGHLHAARAVLDQLGLSRMIFVPSARPPHKGSENGDPIAPAHLRLAWVRAAVADETGFEVDPLEVERDGPSFLVDTLREFGARLAPERPVFVLGADAFREMDTWREPKTLFTLAHFAVTTRPPVASGSLAEWFPGGLGADFEIARDGLSAAHRDAGTWVRLLEIDALDVSASKVRRRIREGADVRYLLPETIHDAVVESGCYA